MLPPWPGAAVLPADGGLATALEARGHDLSGALWSARLLADAPAEILAVHRDYFRAGARIAVTASYQASFPGFAAAGIGHRETENLLRRSVELAARARDELAEDGLGRWVAASVGPYGASLADGSEYRGRYRLGVSGLIAWHRPRLEVLAAAGADLLALETVPDAEEGAALAAAIGGLGVPAWLTYSVEGGRTRAGQPLAEAFEVAAAVPEIVAVGVNCCAPAEVAAEVTGKPVVVYPNSGEGWDARRRGWTGRAAFTPVLVRRWRELGASVIGGCCRTGPAEIAAIAAELGH